MTPEDCPQWRCPHISVEDRREGVTCGRCEPCDCEPTALAEAPAHVHVFKHDLLRLAWYCDCGEGQTEGYLHRAGIDGQPAR